MGKWRQRHNRRQHSSFVTLAESFSGSSVFFDILQRVSIVFVLLGDWELLDPTYGMSVNLKIMIKFEVIKQYYVIIKYYNL